MKYYYNLLQAIKHSPLSLLLFISLFTATSSPLQAQDYLYGMTQNGGSDNLGVIFKTDAEGKNQEVVFEFSITHPGRNPYGELTEVNGKFYGMTSSGGASGYGVLFEFNPADNSFTKKVDFDGTNKGRNPFGSLTLNDGKLYGMTLQGGANGQGVLFEFNPADNSFTKKVDFDGASKGSSPLGSLTLNDGKLYGMTSYGGANDYGVLFEFNPADNSFTKKVDFDNTNKGRNPFGSLTLNDGKLYGMTQSGGANDYGVLFEFNPADNSFTKKVDFDGTNKGRTPFGSLTLNDGKLYGMTYYGGDNGQGVLFEFNPADNSFTKKLDFDGASKGSSPHGSLTLNDGKLYGMTYYGGANGQGVLFEFNPADNSFTKKLDFDGTSKGRNPYGSLTLNDGKLYGMTNSGGASGYGVLFEFNPADNSFTKKVDFDGTNEGRNPFGSLTLNDGKLYGMTYYGGANDYGVLFEFNPADNSFTKKLDFDGTSKGQYPQGSLTLNDGKLYGMTYYGGASGYGVLFEFNPADNSFTKKVDFDGTSKGQNPYGSLTLNDGKLYGMTHSGGASGYGVLFEFNPADNSFTKKVDFDGTNEGRNPFGSLTLNDGKLYGMTHSGGTSGYGVLFEFNPADNSFTKKVDFDGTSKGRNPYGSLTLNDGKLYGMTRFGGASGYGVLFEFNPADNSFTKKVDFDGTSRGKHPEGSLTLKDGKLYGMTRFGGASGYGVLFEFNPSNDAFTKTLDFSSTNGANPLYGHLVVVDCAIVEQTLEVDKSICPNSSTTIQLDGSEVGVTYTLKNKADDSTVDGPEAGTGAAISFTTPTLISSVNYYVTATNTSTGCNLNLADEITITVVDLSAPVLSINQIDRYLDENGLVQISSEDFRPFVVDNCSDAANVNIAISASQFSCNNIGGNLVTVTLTDEAGNQSEYPVTVTILDVIKPVVKTKDLNVYLDENGQASITTQDADNGTYDNCSFTLSLTKTSFTCANLGTQSVYLSAKDPRRNQTTKGFIATVIDTIRPTIKTKDAAAVIDPSTGMASIDVADVNLGSFDNCSLSELYLSKSTFTCADKEHSPISVWLVGKDQSGNMDSTMASVIVSGGNNVFEESLTSCGSYTWSETGVEYTENGTYTAAYTNKYGCDSIYTLHLTINDFYEVNINQTACAAYTWDANNTTYDNSGDYSASFTSAKGCDSTVILHLSIERLTGTQEEIACESYTWALNGSTYDKSGEHQFTTTSLHGCDSIVTLDLTILGKEYTNLSASACESYTWEIKGESYQASGTYYHTATNQFGCDSILVLALEIKEATSGEESIGSCDAYLWNGMSLETTGDYQKTLTAANGCDSVATVHFTRFTASTKQIFETACDNYFWAAANKNYEQGGVYYHTLNQTNINGCDSILELNLTMLESSEAFISPVVCKSYTSDAGNTYNSTGKYEEYFTNAAGCDSTLYIDLNVLNPGDQSIEVVACDFYNSPNNNIYTESGEYQETILTSDNCEINLSISLTINKSKHHSIEAIACDSYTWLGTEYTETGVYTKTLETTAGCDSIVSLDLVVNHANSSAFSANACEKYYWLAAKKKYSESGVYTNTFLNQNGCDSVVTLTLTIDQIDYEFTQADGSFTIIGEDIEVTWLDCNNNLEVVESENTFTPTASGSYAYVVTQGTCVDSSDCFEYVITDINEILSTSISVFPNPSNGKYFFSTSTNNVEDYTLSLFTASGKEIFAPIYKETSSQLAFDLSNFASGVYFVKVSSENNAPETIRIVKF